jgi:DNA-binding NtrC family response regulator
MKFEILVVEGENKEELRKICMSLGNKKGITLHTVKTVKEAYSLLRRKDISIVISDYDLPKVKVLDYLKKIKSIKPYVEIVFLSSKATLSDAINAMKTGAYDFYELPMSVRLLLTVMEKAAEKQSLYFEKKELQEKVIGQFDFSNIYGRSKSMEYVMSTVRTIARKNINVLISGETGTGKELIASAIHYNSPRASKPFIKVNFAALSKGVLESELFGHEKGAFTGALSQRIGRFELANEGTILLDEVGDIPLSTQIKLLRILQEKEFERVGGNETIKVDLRIIAATNRELRKLVNEGKFREDLFYRLNVVGIDLPPLRERKEDIPVLVAHFIQNINKEKDYDIRGITKDAMRLLLEYDWPGNIRELENAVESSMALSEKSMIEAKYLPAFLLVAPSQEREFYHIPSNYTLKEIENEIIKLALQSTSGNRTQTAKKLNIGLRTLQRKIKEIPL